VLKQIKIENYRSCLQTSLDLDTNMSVLIGANGSGKTNILQAIMLLNKMATQEYFGPKTDSITINPHLRCKFGSVGYETRLWASVDAYTDESNTDVILSSKERWTVRDALGKVTSTKLPLALIDPRSQRIQYLYQRRLFKSSVRLRAIAPHSDIEEIPKNILEVLVGTRTFAKGIKYYGASQFTNPGSCPVSFEIEEDGEQSRLFRRRGHLRILYDMYLAKEAKTSKGYEQFLDIVGPRGLKLIDALTFRKVETSSMEYSVRVGGKVEPRRKHKLMIVPQFRIGKQRLSPNQLSEGTFKTLALLFHIITADSTAMRSVYTKVCFRASLGSSKHIRKGS
jgi:hypothetical protein